MDTASGRSRSLTVGDENAPAIKLHGYWPAFPQHSTFIVAETDDTDDAANLRAFLRPGANRWVAEITPVTERPAS